MLNNSLLIFVLYFAACVLAAEHDLGYLSCKDVESHPNRKLLPPISQCGDVWGGERIFGGEEAQLGEYPWMAVLLVRETCKNIWATNFCGGSLINARYVLTAAHCVEAFEQSNLFRSPGNLYKLFVRLGEHNLIKDPDTDGVVTAPPSMEYEVESWLQHDQYRLNGSFYNDIALLRLKDEAKLHRYVQPICLPTSCKLLSFDFVGKKVTVAGWGNLLDAPTVPSLTLQKARVWVVDTAGECPVSYLDKKMWHTLDTQMCARSRRRGKVEDACKGDSGGPLTYATVEGYTAKAYQVGVVSSGIPCSLWMNAHPGIYTRVSSFMPWILDNIKP